jgi:hypothetical protein
MGKKCNCCRWAVHKRCKFGHQKKGLETSPAFHRNTYQNFPNEPTPYTTKKHIWLHSLLKVGQKAEQWESLESMSSRRSFHLIKDCVRRCSHLSLLCVATFVALCYFSFDPCLKPLPFGGLTSNSVYRVGRSTAFTRYLHTLMNTCYH